MAEETVVLEETAVETEVAPGGPSTLDTDRSEPDPVASMRDQLGRFIKKDQPKTEGEPSKDKEVTANVSEAGDKGKVQGAKGTDSVVDTAKKEAKDTPKELSSWEIEAAKQLGYDADTIAKMDPEIWGPVLDKVGRKLSKGLSDLGHLQQKLRVDAGTKAKPSTEDKDSAVFTDDDFDEIGEGGVSDKMTKAFRGLSDRLSVLESSQSDHEEAVLAEQADAFFEKLDAKEFPQFGEGPASSLGETSSELFARQAVLDESEMLQVAAELLGKELSLNQALEKAVQFLHSNDIAASERRKITEQVKQRRRGAGDKPTQRKAKPTAATSKAEERAEYIERAKELGVNWI